MLRHAFPALWLHARLAFLRWARTELTQTNPMHPDLPGLVVAINELERPACN
jgi:hypothetical protein